MDSAPDFESGGCGFESRRECSLLLSISVLFRVLWVTIRGVRPRFASIAQLAEHVLRKHKVTSSILVGGSPVVTALGRWSRGMILPSGGRGRGFDSRTAPLLFILFLIIIYFIFYFFYPVKLFSEFCERGLTNCLRSDWNLERGHPLKLERYRED